VYCSNFSIPPLVYKNQLFKDSLYLGSPTVCICVAPLRSALMRMWVPAGVSRHGCASRQPGGTGGRPFDGTNSQPHKLPGNTATPTIMTPAHFAGDRVHAVLGAFWLSQFTHKRTLPKNANQMKNTTKPNHFSYQRDHQVLHIRNEYPHIPAASSAVLRSCGNALAELLREPDEKSFGTADVAEPIRVLVLNHFADELRAALA